MEKAKSIYSEFIDREEIDKHHSYSDELRLCAAMQAAHPSALEIARTLFHAEHAGLLSEDPLTNLKYLLSPTSPLSPASVSKAACPRSLPI